MSNIVDISKYRKKSEAEKLASIYLKQIGNLDKLDLLEEMVKFQQQRRELGELTFDMIVTGRVLFSRLWEVAETPELKLLTRSYVKHLDHEYNILFKEKNVV